MKAQYHGIKLEGTPEEIIKVLEGLKIAEQVRTATVNKPMSDLAQDIAREFVENIKKRSFIW